MPPDPLGKARNVMGGTYGAYSWQVTPSPPTRSWQREALGLAWEITKTLLLVIVVIVALEVARVIFVDADTTADAAYEYGVRATIGIGLAISLAFAAVRRWRRWRVRRQVKARFERADATGQPTVLGHVEVAPRREGDA